LCSGHTDKKENQIFLIFKENQSGAVAKSYMGKGFLIYGEMRKYFPIYEEAVTHIWLCICSIPNFLIVEENLIFFFISAGWEVQTDTVQMKETDIHSKKRFSVFPSLAGMSLTGRE
jgi:hypothetical protein